DPMAQQGRCLYLPRFDARDLPTPPRGRGFGVQVYQSAGDRHRSHFSARSYGEMLPRAENCVTLHPSRKDAWGIPVLHIDAAHSHLDRTRGAEQFTALRDLAEAAGVRLTHIDAAPAPPGAANHECGTARMGDDPATSVLDPYNECWDARGLYLTDGACLPSQ